MCRCRHAIVHRPPNPKTLLASPYLQHRFRRYHRGVMTSAMYSDDSCPIAPPLPAVSFSEQLARDVSRILASRLNVESVQRVEMIPVGDRRALRIRCDRFLPLSFRPLCRNAPRRTPLSSSLDPRFLSQSSTQHSLSLSLRSASRPFPEMLVRSKPYLCVLLQVLLALAVELQCEPKSTHPASR
jgi:hypothetical protein